jgi:hypothetical protein
VVDGLGGIAAVIKVIHVIVQHLAHYRCFNVALSPPSVHHDCQHTRQASKPCEVDLK